MKTLLETLFGANWRTTVTGWLTLFFGAIYVIPKLVDWVPDPIRGYLVGAAGLVAVLTGGAFAASTKDKQVTGNGTISEPYAVKDTITQSSRIVPVIIGAFLISSLGLTGCVTQREKLSTWWTSAATQNNVHLAEQAAFNFAVNVGLSALQSYANGGKVDLQSAAIAGGINTLYSQASSLRQLQGTNLVLDPIATAQVLENGGGSKVISEEMAQQIIANARALVNKGVAPDTASEINAAGLDAAASRAVTTPDAPVSL